MLNACKGAHTLFTGQRESESERERKRDKEGETQRERCRICPKWQFLFFKGMSGASVPFIYLVT
jgi:hypothetical protein